MLLPKVPMRPRNFDPRVGFFTVDRVNYGLDEQKAATETFITRWRLEPKDPAAYARGELVEPIKPIIYYIDPATPTKWRRYVKEGVENWQKVFEKAGFKNAIIAKDPPTKEEDPDWDPDDARVLDGALGGEPRAQRGRPAHARPAHRRDHQQRDHLVSQPHAVVSQPADASRPAPPIRWRGRSTFRKS